MAKHHKDQSSVYLNTPNLISYSRAILTIPIILVYPNRILMVLLLTIAAISDWADGYTARKQNMSSKQGAIIDPLCNKILFLGLVLFFLAKGELNIFGVLVLLIRDLYSLALILFTGFFSLFEKRVLALKGRLKARWPGKITTALIFVAMFWIITRIPYFEYYIFIVLLSATVTIIDHTIQYGKGMSRVFENP